MGRTVIVPKDSPPPLAPYSPGVRAGDFVFVSGIVPIDEKGKVVGAGDVAAQTRQVLSLIKAVLEAAGGSLDDIVFNQIFLRDLADYAAMNGVYKAHFPKDPPARYCVRAELVKSEFLVEIAATAHIPSPGRR